MLGYALTGSKKNGWEAHFDTDLLQVLTMCQSQNVKDRPLRVLLS